jgi:GNAT superfamily N-acetyltransferase
MNPPNRFPPAKPIGTAPPPYRPVQPAHLLPQTHIQLNPAQHVGGNAYRITAGGGIGSVMVHDSDRRSIEITDLKVHEQHRKRGFGGGLMASALREGVLMGKTEVMLAAQDNGRGTLTRWYTEMGFTQTGRTLQGYPMMSAPIGRVLSTLARRPVGVAAASSPTAQARLEPPKLAAPPRYIPTSPRQALIAPPRFTVAPIATLARRPVGVAAASSPTAQARLEPPKLAAPRRYIPTSPGQALIAPPRFTVAPIATRSIGRPAIQRMEARCDWCSTQGCHEGSICKSRGNNPGIYNARTEDQKHLSSQFGKPVNGDSHQMEHPFGYAVIGKGVKRKSSALALRIENEAPAYHEEKEQHRKHEGTGNTKKYKRESGLNAPEYRDWTRTALQDQNPDIAIGINQMTYGHQKLEHDSIGQQQALDSYIRMVKNMGRIPFINDMGQEEYRNPPTAEMKFDMIVFRFATIFKRYPSEEEQMGIVGLLGVIPDWFSK